MVAFIDRSLCLPRSARRAIRAAFSHHVLARSSLRALFSPGRTARLTLAHCVSRSALGALFARPSLITCSLVPRCARSSVQAARRASRSLTVSPAQRSARFSRGLPSSRARSFLAARALQSRPHGAPHARSLCLPLSARRAFRAAFPHHVLARSSLRALFSPGHTARRTLAHCVSRSALIVSPPRACGALDWASPLALTRPPGRRRRSP